MTAILTAKMSHLKYLNSLRIISKKVHNVLFFDKKSLCIKKMEGLDIKIKLDKNKDEKTKSDSILFEHDEDAGTVVVTEREKDASVISKLSKEYNKYISGKNIKVLNIKDGFKLNIRVDSQMSTTGDKTLDQTITKLSDTCENKSLPTGDEALDKTISKLKETAATPPSPPSQTPPSKRIILQRQEPGEVIFAFIPKEWFTFFIPITGFTGFGTFLFTTGIFLVSKEYYVLEHNYYGGLSMAIMVWASYHYLGEGVAKYLDKEIQEYLDDWNNGKKATVASLDKLIEDEVRVQFQADGNLMLVEAKRENVYLQLEDEFRKRQLRVYNDVKHLLDYQVAVGDIQRKIHQKNLVDYVTKHVLSSFTPEMNAQLINSSIDDLIQELTKLIKEETHGSGGKTNTSGVKKK